MILMILIEPLTKMLVNGNTIEGEKVKKKLFGGFCTCGGIMYQKSWFRHGNSFLMVSECEKCWRNEVMVFNGNKVISRNEVKVVDRTQIKHFLRDILSSSEYEALMARTRQEDYNYSAFSRAKKKLEDMGLSVEEVLTFF
ncbi:MAG: hypothetical protein DRO98_02050 [Archaeoglobales archaeon]|nr:MAG: hypothetical protein DRO98_02050 [Archaeoglobales archaeon]